MPLIKKRPSFNYEVIKGMTKQELLDMHPDADEEHVISEWEKAIGKGKDKESNSPENRGIKKTKDTGV